MTITMITGIAIACLSLGIFIGLTINMSKISSLRTENKLIKEQQLASEEKSKRLDQKIEQEFKNIANSILIESTEKIHGSQRQQLSSLLDPLKEKLGEFQNRIEQNTNQQASDGATLKEQIKQLTELNQQVGTEANRLAQALKSESKTRGNWGEMVLSGLLNASGLIKDTHYSTQKSYTDNNGKRQIPDVVVHLPDDRDIIIDSKVSLVAYERIFNEVNTDEQRKQHQVEHLQSVMNHINDLSSKRYQDLEKNKIFEMVFMFMPIEQAFIEAINQEKDLYEYAFRKNVILITPSTLVAALKLIYTIWRQDDQNKNASKIAELGGRLYDKFYGFIEDMNKIGSQIDKAKEEYKNAMSKLNGHGGLTSQANRLREMGASAKKPALISDDTLDEN